MNDENWLDYILDNGYLPHFIIRAGIRRQLDQRLRMIASTSLEGAFQNKMRFVEALRKRPIAVETKKANEQHYEVGTGLLKGTETLGQAEVEMLSSYVKKGELKDGMSILDLGCGWGSLCLYLAEIFPDATVTAFSNSTTQKAHIDEVAKRNNFTNLTVITGDIADPDSQFPPAEAYDRVVSIELFEHMKNYELLMRKISRSLKPGGKFFVHYFSHKDTPYNFEGGWMTDHFFTGGTMLSSDLLMWFQCGMEVNAQWWVNGRHYAKTCEDWLVKMTENKQGIWQALEMTYGRGHASMWFYRWQIFYMACAELFAWQGGDTWGVTQYLFTKPEK